MIFAGSRRVPERQGVWIIALPSGCLNDLRMSDHPALLDIIMPLRAPNENLVTDSHPVAESSYRPKWSRWLSCEVAIDVKPLWIGLEYPSIVHSNYFLLPIREHIVYLVTAD
jgi:hypothetical protein